MKSHTDIEQSKKLAEILPIESADAWYHGHYSPWKSERKYDDNPCPFHSVSPNWDKPCWSLAALLDILPYPTLAQHANGLWSLTAWRGHRVLVCRELRIECLEQPLERLELAVRVDKNYNVFALIDNLRINLTDENNLVDACYKTILELHEQKLL